MKKILLGLSCVIVFFVFSNSVRAQVAVNTNGASPNASAMLDVSSNNKGVLIPRVSLQSSTDGVTIPSPATSLLVWNTNSGTGNGVGYYYNNGTPAIPNWQPVLDIVLPFYKGTSTNGSAFTIENFSQNAASTAIKASAGGAGNALEVSGKMKIAGTGQTPAAGKVLTSDANGNATWQGAVAFSAVGIKNDGSKEFNTGTFKKIAFGSVVYDLSGNYTDANGTPHSTFTAPVKGIYHFDVHIIWDISSGGSVDLSLWKTANGVSSRITYVENSSVDYPDLMLSTEVLLEAGQSVYATGYHSNGGTKILFTDASSAFFNGRLVIKL